MTLVAGMNDVTDVLFWDWDWVAGSVADNNRGESVGERTGWILLAELIAMGNTRRCCGERKFVTQ